MKYYLVISLSFLCSLGDAQIAPSDPVFTNFIGDAYKMEKVKTGTKNGIDLKQYKEHYGKFVYDYPKIGKVNLPKLNVPETNTKNGKFPGIDKTVLFAMVLNSTMTISTRACYEFSLTSDDGSVLWIDDKKIIGNDGGHKMTMKKDSLIYNPGIYDVKVWYFQSYPNKFGIIMDSKIIGKADVCPNALEEKQTETIALNYESEVLFDRGSADLKIEAEIELNKLVQIIKEKNPKSIAIIGHTCSDGTKKSNQVLSEQRAENIANALSGYLGTAIPIITSGQGESMPIATNDTEEAREKNRRVEIVLTMN